jgi:hypothetical protein
MKEPLPDDLQDFLDAERDLDVPANATRDRLFARLVPFVLPSGGGGAGLSSTGGASGVAKAAAGTGVLARAGWRGKVLLSVFSAAVGAGGGAAGHAMLTSPKSAAIVVAPPTAATIPMAPATAPQSVETAPTAETAEAAASPPSANARSEERTHVGSLRAERLLIETASAALTRGDYTSALASLRKHARVFPHGELTQEREVLMVQALKASGDDAAAQQRAKDFKQKFPGSVQQGTVDKASPE